jgi:hypothetical protein
MLEDADASTHSESQACTPPAERSPMRPSTNSSNPRPIHYCTHNGLIKMDEFIYIHGIYDEFGACTEVE